MQGQERQYPGPAAAMFSDAQEAGAASMDVRIHGYTGFFLSHCRDLGWAIVAVKGAHLGRGSPGPCALVAQPGERALIIRDLPPN